MGISKSKVLLATLSLFILLSSVHLKAQRQMEDLGRGVVAVRTGTNEAFISWRLLGTESNTIGFNVYRSADGGTAKKLNSTPLIAGTNITDKTMSYTTDNSYFVTPVINGIEQEASTAFTLTANHTIDPCVVVPLKSGNAIHFVWVGDLDGDGEYDYVLDRLDWEAKNQKIEAYKSDGTYLWTIDFGANLNLNNISPGPSVIDVGNWDGLTVFDMDGDGKAEVLLKTASGVTFGDNTKLSYSDPNVQFVSVIDGMSGAERARTEIPNNYLSVGPLACSMGIGYLNGLTPSLVGFFKNRNTNGSFNRLQCAWDFDGTNLELKWKTNLLFGASYSAHGADGHQMRILDFDGDGKDDVGHVAFVLNGEDGSLKYDLGNEGIVHGDRWHVGKLDPSRPGLQGYGVQQDQADGLIEYYYDAGTGKVLWKHSGTGIVDVGRGIAADIDPRHPGYEVWSFNGQYNCKTNTKISNSNPYPNFRLWWDGDALSENLNDSKIEKWNYSSASTSRLLTAWNYYSATGSDRSAPMFYGDIMGDWREEVIYTSNDNSKLVIFTTPIPTTIRLYTLAHNPEYRNSMTVKGYLQSHMLDYYLGDGMTTPPTPPIQTAKCIWKGSASTNIWNTTNSNWRVEGDTGSYTQGDDVMFDISGQPNTSVLLDEILTPSSVKVITALNYSFDGSGTISGTSGLLKAGSGELTFNSPMRYSGSTRVEEGALYVNDTLTHSPVIVYMGALLGGNGSISQSVKLIKGAYLSPGEKDATGTLSFAKDLTISADCIALYDITNDTTGMQKPSDKITINGDLSISSAMTLVINKKDGEILPGSYPLIRYTGTFTGNINKIAVSGLFGQKYVLTNTEGTLYLNVIGARETANITWSGTSGLWDLQTTIAWSLNNSPVKFVANDSVTFDETGSKKSIVSLIGTLPVEKLVVNTSENDYVFRGTGNIGGSGTLIKNGEGILSLFTSNSFTGNTIVNAGTLRVNSLDNAGANSSIGANTSVNPSAFILNNATLMYSGATDSRTDKGLTIGDTSTTIEISNPSATLSIKGFVRGSGELMKSGAGTLHLMSNDNTYSGGTVIKKGTIQLNDPGSSLDIKSLGSGIVSFKGGALKMGNTRSYTSCNLNFHVPENYYGTLYADIRCNYGGKLTGSGTLNIELPGNIDRTIFKGNWSTFTGTVHVGGVSPMRLSSSAGYRNMTFDLASGMTLYYSTGTSGGDNVAQTVYVGGLKGASDSYLSSENWIIGGAHENTIFKGQIQGNSITKEGNGMLTLTNNSTYAGGTKINAGTLYVSNIRGSATGTGSVTVNSGGILAGTGIITGSVNVNKGGTLSPGGNYGTLTINNKVTLRSGSQILIKVNPDNNSSDQLNTGNSQLTLNGTLTLEVPASGTLKEGNSFKLFTGSNITGSFESIEPSNPAPGLSWDTSLLEDQGILKVATASAIREISKEKLLVYPNPTSGIIKIHNATESPITSITLIDLSGKIVLLKAEAEISEIDMSALNAGIYILEIKTKNQVIPYKVTRE